jgi:hypothetical protein
MPGPVDRVWALLEDGPRPLEVLGAERVCEVEFEGKRGQVTERCVESEPLRRIGWQLVDDSLGFGRLFTDLGFSFALEPRGHGATLVRNESYYQPRSLLARLLSIMFIRPGRASAPCVKQLSLARRTSRVHVASVSDVGVCARATTWCLARVAHPDQVGGDTPAEACK